MEDGAEANLKDRSQSVINVNRSSPTVTVFRLVPTQRRVVTMPLVPGIMVSQQRSLKRKKKKKLIKEKMRNGHQLEEGRKPATKASSLLLRRVTKCASITFTKDVGMDTVKSYPDRFSPCDGDGQPVVTC